MSTLTLRQHLARAGEFRKLVERHRADLADLADDVPKAIAIAQDFHELFKAQEEARSVAAANATAPEQNAPAPAVAPARPKPPAALRSPPLTARQAAEHVAENGLTVAEKIVFDRAGSSGTG